MEMNGKQRLPVAQDVVWRALNDPEVLKACIPGCETVDRISDEEYVVTLVAAVGPVRAKFKGRMLLKDLDPPHSYRLAFEGQGGVAGFGKGEAHVSLVPEGGATVMSYTAKAQVGGKLAQVGSRLIDAAASKISDQFFAAFNQRVAPVGASEPVELETKASGVPDWAWAVGVAVLIGIAYYALSR
jgi:carbon monoxide dehydrogenase subunit G